MIHHIRAYTCLPGTVLSRKHAENPPTKDGFDRSIRIKLSKPAEPTEIIMIRSDKTDLFIFLGGTIICIYVLSSVL
jgi:hypothetical protein